MAFYRIKEAASKVGVLPHVLRFWESQFPHLKPNKTGKGQRLYDDKTIESFLKIKHLLYTEGYSIPGAKKYLKEEKSGLRKDTSQAVQRGIEKNLLSDIKSGLLELRKFVQEL